MDTIELGLWFLFALIAMALLFVTIKMMLIWLGVT